MRTSLPGYRSTGVNPEDQTLAAILIPRIVLYTKNNIPFEVQQKGDEIKQLAQKAENLGLVIPVEYYDPVLIPEILAIPIFDASHPTPERTENRHHLGIETLEGFTTTRETSMGVLQEFTPGLLHREANCPKCRLPIHPEYLLIDTVFQDAILESLRQSTTGL
jgi:hypothetical protein